MNKRRADYEEQLAIAKAAVYGGLHPVDLRRCQAERRVGDPWRIGDPIRWERCDRVPSKVAIEPELDKLTKTRGAMALCRSCATKCAEQRPEALIAEAAPFKAAFLLGGHKAVRDMVYAYRP